MPYENTTFVQKRGDWPYSFLTNVAVLHANAHPVLFFALIAACFFLLSGGLCNLCGIADRAKCPPKGLCSQAFKNPQVPSVRIRFPLLNYIHVGLNEDQLAQK